MHSEDLKKQISMSYDAQVQVLLKKYGPAEYDYFLDDVSWEKSRFVARTSEGLQCHHIDEDTIPTLSDPSIARLHPFVHQKRERLVYCNFLEHLLLHMKIGYDRFFKNHEKISDPSEFVLFLSHGVRMLTREINALYHEDGSVYAWENTCYARIRDHFPDYTDMLGHFLFEILDHYQPLNLQKGDCLIDENGQKAVVVSIAERWVTLQFSGHREEIRREAFLDESSQKAMEEVRRILADSYEGLVEEVYENI
jgi:hypothetical protein